MFGLHAGEQTKGVRKQREMFRSGPTEEQLVPDTQLWRLDTTVLWSTPHCHRCDQPCRIIVFSVRISPKLGATSDRAGRNSDYRGFKKKAEIRIETYQWTPHSNFTAGVLPPPPPQQQEVQGPFEIHPSPFPTSQTAAPHDSVCLNTQCSAA